MFHVQLVNRLMRLGEFYGSHIIKSILTVPCVAGVDRINVCPIHINVQFILANLSKPEKNMELQIFNYKHRSRINISMLLHHVFAFVSCYFRTLVSATAQNKEYKKKETTIITRQDRLSKSLIMPLFCR